MMKKESQKYHEFKSEGYSSVNNKPVTKKI